MKKYIKKSCPPVSSSISFCSSSVIFNDAMKSPTPADEPLPHDAIKLVALCLMFSGFGCDVWTTSSAAGTRCTQSAWAVDGSTVTGVGSWYG